jgi:hypothetical protein
MTRSIFDPTGGNAERSGNRFTPPDADQISSLPDAFTNPTAPPASGDVGFQLPPEPPAIEVATENDGKLLVVKMTGKLQAEDYKHFVPAVDASVARHGKIRMLVEMHNFHGWSPGGVWEDMKFDMKHFHAIERLALVGDKTWEKWMAVICKPFTTAAVRYFPKENAAEAREWITQTA